MKVTTHYGISGQSAHLKKLKSVFDDYPSKHQLTYNGCEHKSCINLNNITKAKQTIVDLKTEPQENIKHQ